MPGLSAYPAQAGSLVDSRRSTGENIGTARHDPPLLIACVYAQAGLMDGFPTVKVT